MKKILAILMACLLLPVAAHADAYFAPKGEMISNSVVIAVVDITEVSSQSLSVTGVVARLYAEISALVKDYPELGQFPEKARPLQEDGRVEVRFSHNVKRFSEMRETSPTDLGTNGIEIVFMVLDEPNEAWTTAANPPLHLDSLKKTLYSHLVLSTNPSPGLPDKLGAIMDKYKALLQDLNKKVANKASDPSVEKPETQVAAMGESQVHKVATRAAEAEGYDLKNFAAPKTTFDSKTRQWSLFFEGTVVSAPGNHFWALVDDRTGKASVRHGE